MAAMDPAAAIPIAADIPETKKQWEDMVMEMKRQQLENMGIIEMMKKQIKMAEDIVGKILTETEAHIPDAQGKFNIMIWSRSKIDSAKPNEFVKGILESKAVQSLEKIVDGQACRMWNKKLKNALKQTITKSRSILIWLESLKEKQVDEVIKLGPNGMSRLEAIKEMWKQTGGKGDIDEQYIDEINRAVVRSSSCLSLSPCFSE